MYTNQFTPSEDLKFRAPQPVLVYGTLKEGFHNHHIMESEGNSLYCGEFYTKNDDFLMYSAGGFPMVVKALDNNGYRIKGELYLVNKSVLRRMDRLEGHPYWYKRSRVILDDGTVAFIYIMDREGVKGYKTIPVVQHTDEGIKYQQWLKGHAMSLNNIRPPLTSVPLT